jgi:magnesium-transporting ATPase (P-type)
MDGYVESWSFVAEYCLYVLIAVIGMLQLIATRWQIRGISFFRNKGWGYAFGIIAIAAVFIWFFRFTGLKLAQPTFDTPPQLFWLSISTFLAVAVTLAISSIVNRKLAPHSEGDDRDEGIEALKRKTYWRAIARYFKDKAR